MSDDESDGALLRVSDGPEGTSIAAPLVPEWVPTTGADGRVTSETSQLGGGVMLRRVHVEDDAFHPSSRRHVVVHLAGNAELELLGGERVPLRVGLVALSEDRTGGHRIVRSAAEGSAPRLTLLVPLPDDEEADLRAPAHVEPGGNDVAGSVT